MGVRRIVFRGYNLKNKKWLYGYYLVNRGKHFIAEEGIQPPGITWEDFEVDPESVGQYVVTINDADIYEGDIISVENTLLSTKEIGAVIYNEYDSQFNVFIEDDKFIPITKLAQNTEMLGFFRYYEYLYKIIGKSYECEKGID